MKFLQDGLVVAAIQTILTSLGVAFIVLCLATYNWYISMIGILNIFCII